MNLRCHTCAEVTLHVLATDEENGDKAWFCNSCRSRTCAVDALVIKPWGSGYGVFDLVGEKFVSDRVTLRRWMEAELRERRLKFRPVIVRWIYGIPTKQSYAQGIPS